MTASITLDDFGKWANAGGPLKEFSPSDVGKFRDAAPTPQSSQLGAKLAAVSGGVAAAGAVLEGYSQARTLRRQAALAEANRDNANMTANQNAEAILRRGHQVIGAQTAAIAENGIEFTGSALDALGTSATNLQLDVNNALYAGEVRAIDFNNQARADRVSAANAITGGWVGAASQLLSAAGKAVTAGMQIPGG